VSSPAPSRVTASAAPSRSGVLLFCGLSLCLLGPLLASAHHHTDVWAPRHSTAQEIKFLPTGEFLKASSLGYSSLVADIFWIRATMLFGERHGRGDKDWYAWLYHMVDITTDLDPEFRAAYKYGGTMLRVDGVFVDQSSLIFQKGMKHRPDEWYFPFGIAMNYFLHRKDSAIAARYMEIASRTDGAPFYLRNLAASLLSESDQLDAALIFTREELDNLPSGQDKIRIALELKVFELEYMLARRGVERALTAYRREHGEHPAQPSDLSDIPRDPLGGTWTWDRSPDAEFGSLTSRSYCKVFTERSVKASLGRLSIAACTEQGP